MLAKKIEKKPKFYFADRVKGKWQLLACWSIIPLSSAGLEPVTFGFGE